MAVQSVPKRERGAVLQGIDFCLHKISPYPPVSPKPTYCSDLFESIKLNFYWFSFIGGRFRDFITPSPQVEPSVKLNSTCIS